jgi:hypothetical protein
VSDDGCVPYVHVLTDDKHRGLSSNQLTGLSVGLFQGLASLQIL